MTAWTVASIFLYRRPRLWILVADLVITASCLLASALVQSETDLGAGWMPLTGIWVATPAFAWGVYGGRRAGALAGLALALCDLWIGGLSPYVAHGGKVILVLGGWVAGHVTRLLRDAESRMQEATEMAAATRERERMARDIHDSVLQVLALVQRRGAEIGGEAAELGRLAGEQEAALRNLIRGHPDPGARSGGGRHADGIQSGPPWSARFPWAARSGDDGKSDLRSPSEQDTTDLRPLLSAHESRTVVVSTPATPIELPTHAVDEISAAVGAALDNVRAHCDEGTMAWILAEEIGETVIVTVRDDGPGIDENRLDQAEAEGRFGVAQSIKGRINDLGGTVTITTAPGEGTEIEISVPTP